MTVLIVGREEGAYTLLKGNLRDWLSENEILALSSPRNRGWWLRSERLPDVLALAEHQGVLIKSGMS
jgi:hypothetical protein